MGGSLHRPTREPAATATDDALQTLAGAVREAAAGSGSAALVTGEAGIGKTSLVRAFVERPPAPARVLAGGVRRPARSCATRLW